MVSDSDKLFLQPIISKFMQQTDNKHNNIYRASNKSQPPEQ